MKKYKLADVFAGTGAFSWAFESTGLVKTVFANDICPNSEMIYNLNFKVPLTRKDIHTIREVPDFDILTAGIPCQSYSIAGSQKGFLDSRASVFFPLLDIIESVRPKVFVIENVKGLFSNNQGKSFNIIKTNLENLNYFLKYQILDTAKLTKIPQHRERIFIVGFKDKTHYNEFNFDFPEIENLPISSFLSDNVNKKYYYNERFKSWPVIVREVKKENVFYQYRRFYVRENKNGLCPTLTANAGKGGHNVPIFLDSEGIRKLTPRECFNFQGFPGDFKLPTVSDSIKYILAGNSISIPIGQLIANRIVEILNDSNN